VRGDRLRWVAVLVMIHASLGLVGRLTGLIGDAAVYVHGAIVMLIVGLGGDVLEAGRLGLPIALMWVLLPARWYQSFAFWMLTGFVSLSAIAVSVALALERARGAVTGTVSDLLSAIVVPDNFWLQHPIAAALIAASLCAALLLGPVRRAATAAWEVR